MSWPAGGQAALDGSSRRAVDAGRMQTRKLGTELVTSALGLGCLGLSGLYGPAEEKDSLAVVRRAIDHGVTLLDTADFYGDGRNEELIGRAVAGRRDDVILATRGGVRAPAPGKPPSVLDGTPEYLRTACDASLRRLGVDRIDLYYLGRVDPQVDIEESVGALAELAGAGKIRFVGVSEVTAEQLRRAASVHPITAVESEYSLWERQIETTVLPVARELGTGLVAHGPLGRGFLTGTLTSPDQFGPRDIRRNHPRFQGDNFDRNRESIGVIERLAKRHGIEAGQLVLAWLLSRGADIVPIPGTRSPEHLAQNVAAVALEVPSAVLDELTEAFPAGGTAGSRLAAHAR